METSGPNSSPISSFRSHPFSFLSYLDWIPWAHHCNYFILNSFAPVLTTPRINLTIFLLHPNTKKTKQYWKIQLHELVLLPASTRPVGFCSANLSMVLNWLPTANIPKHQVPYPTFTSISSLARLYSLLQSKNWSYGLFFLSFQSPNYKFIYVHPMLIFLLYLKEMGLPEANPVSNWPTRNFITQIIPFISESLMSFYKLRPS